MDDQLQPPCHPAMPEPEGKVGEQGPCYEKNPYGAGPMEGQALLIQTEYS